MLTILLIDDNASDIALYTSYLRRGLYEPHTCVQQPTIAAALTHLRDYPADLLILDLGLPDAQGLSGVRQLHASSPDTPMLVVTGHVEDDLPARVEAIGSGITFLAKGDIVSETFGMRVRTLLELHSLRPQPMPRGTVVPIVAAPYPSWYPYARDAVLIGALLGILAMHAWEKEAVSREHRMMLEDVSKAHRSLEKAIVDLVTALTKKSHY